MTAMGRPRKPTATLRLQGTYQECRHGERHEPVVDGLPVKPSWLTGDASTLWDSMLSRLGPSAVLTAADSETMAGLCRWYQVWRRLDAALDDDDPANRPKLTEVCRAWNRFAEFAGRFGLTPSDRAKLQTPAKEEKSEFMDLLSKSG